MKKKFIVILGVAVFGFAVAANVNIGMSKSDQSVLVSSIVEALATPEDGNCANYGPAEYRGCGLFNIKEKKTCKCEPQHPCCTETDCY